MAKITVPINPDTKVRRPQQALARSADLTEGAEAVANAVSEFSTFLRQERAQQEDFQVNKAVLEEINERQKVLDQRMDDADLGAPGFTENIMGEFSDRTEGLLERHADLSDEALQRLQLRLGAADSEFLGSAIAFQSRQELAKFDSGADEMVASASSYAFRNPNSIDSVYAEGEVLQDAPGPASVGQERFDRYKDTTLDAAMRGLATQEPQVVIDALGFGLEVVQQPMAGGKAPEQFLPVENAKKVAENLLPGVRITDHRRDPNSPLGRANPKSFHVRTGAAVDMAPIPGMTFEEVVQRFQDAGYFVHPDSEDEVKNPSPHATAPHWHFVLGEGDPNAQPEKISRLSPAEQQKLLERHPVLSKLDGQQLALALSMAQQRVRAANSDRKAELKLRLDNANAAWLAQGEGPLIPREEIISVFGELAGGQIAAEHENTVGVGRQIQEFRKLSGGEIGNRLEALRPKDPNSDTFAIEQEAYSRAQQAARVVDQQRKDDPMAYVLGEFPEVAAAFSTSQTTADRAEAYRKLDRAYDTLGIPENDRTVFTSEALDEVAGEYEALGIESKLGQIQSWHAEMGEGLFKSFVKQLGESGKHIARDHFVWRHLSQAATRPREVKQVMLDYFRGQEIMNENRALRPSLDAIDREFLGGMDVAIDHLNSRAGQYFNDIATALYVANGGRVEKGELSDKNLYISSLNRAVGGLADDPQTGIVFMRGSGGLFSSGRPPTILPPGVNRQQFQDWLLGLTPGDLTKLTERGSPPVDKFGNLAELQDILDEGVFVMLAPNQYAIEMGEGFFLKAQDGGDYTVAIPPGVILFPDLWRQWSD